MRTRLANERHVPLGILNRGKVRSIREFDALFSRSGNPNSTRVRNLNEDIGGQRSRAAAMQVLNGHTIQRVHIYAAKLSGAEILKKLTYLSKVAACRRSNIV